MMGLKNIQKNLEVVDSLKEITSTYHEIANLEMNRIRKDVLATREFLEGVAQIYRHAKLAYIATLRNEKQALEKVEFIRRNGKKIIVFLSANERFYGPLIIEIWQEVLKNLTSNYELAVVGKIGKYFAQQQRTVPKFSYFDLDDDHPKSDEIQTILKSIRQYETIIVFHGRFETVTFQKAVQSNISGGITFDEKDFPSREKIRKYIFEPSPRAILEFFENEIIDAFFQQTILEHQLAKFASRMMAMYQATENAKKLIRKLQHQKENIQKEIQNKKQLERISSFKLWEKEI